MYNDTIKVANKIITADDLLEIFEKMHLELLECNKKYENEKIIFMMILVRHLMIMITLFQYLIQDYMK